jgi:hypothetical protein
MRAASRRISFTVKLEPIDHRFLEQVRSERKLSVRGDSVRLLIGAVRSLFSLPGYQASRIREDIAAKGLDVLTYVQELLARRYEALATADLCAEPTASVAPSPLSSSFNDADSSRTNPDEET